MHYVPCLKVKSVQSLHLAMVLSDSTGSNQDLYSSLSIQSVLNLAGIFSVLRKQ